MNETIENSNNKSKKHTLLIIILVLVGLFILFGFIPLTKLIIKTVHNSKIEKKDKEFREYLSKIVPYELSDKADVGSCHSRCDYYGNYMLKDDLTYQIAIREKSGSYEISYNNESQKNIENRKILYDYIKKEKKDRFVSDYLIAFGNGGLTEKPERGKTSLSYIVYYDSTIDFDEQLESDYKIMKKTVDMNPSLDLVYVYYIRSDKMKEDRWLEKYIDDVSHYYYVGTNIVDDNSSIQKKVYYYYSISDRDLENANPIYSFKNISLEDYKKVIYSNLVTYN